MSSDALAGVPYSIFTLLQQEGACFPSVLFSEHYASRATSGHMNILIRHPGMFFPLLFAWMTPSNLSSLNSNVTSSCKASLNFLFEDALPPFSLLTTLFIFFIGFNCSIVLEYMNTMVFICNQSNYVFFVYSQSYLEYKIHEWKYLFMSFILEFWELIQYHQEVGAQWISTACLSLGIVLIIKYILES